MSSAAFKTLSAALCLAARLAAQGNAPFYTVGSIVNAASNQPGAIAPNSFVTIYGTELSYVTRAISADDIRGNSLPTVLLGTGTRVLVNGLPANVFYVSPGQLNILMPAGMSPGTAEIQVVRDGRSGPAVVVPLLAAAPALFSADAQTAIATHADYSLVTASSPARPGETIVLWANGLGPTTPPAIYGEIVRGLAPLSSLKDFKVLLNGTAVDSERVSYAGISPGSAGVFQVNVALPADCPGDPEVKLAAGEAMSPGGLKLAVSPAGPRPPAF